MKILITTDTYYPMTNGVVVSINNLYKQLKALGHDVKILALSTDGEEKITSDVFYLSSFSVAIYPDARVMKPIKNKIVGEIIRWKPDIIHSQTEFSTMIVAKYIKRKLNIPEVHTYHTMYEDYLHYFFCGRILGRVGVSKVTEKLLNSCEAVIAPTEKVRNKLKGYGVTTNIDIVPTGIDLDKFKKELSKEEKEELLSKYELSEKDIVLIYVGRIAEEKNIEEVLKLYKMALGYTPNIKLLIVGGGPYLSKLKGIVITEGISDKVKFTGMIPSDKVYKYYKLGDVFVTASTSETQGITYIEALASGLPIICKWDMCIEGLIVNGQNGFSYEDDEEFLGALQYIINNKKFKLQMVEKISEKMVEYSKERFASKVLLTYNSALKEGYSYYLAKQA
ncbi:glycosyltransferase family 4 protein [Clostridium felsineum]|uniref:glycosyltransferase family 4 protein n=1 Tax=Clostridium felsineum TaxID=36839 RepID=UPI00098CE723|nr:glycosyltransferase family 4 protein [Clostridium felsineum]URZ04334.1 Alpha-monoglucosyldiacylglycerol synthase [Clostridium felsineum]